MTVYRLTLIALAFLMVVLTTPAGAVLALDLNPDQYTSLEISVGVGNASGTDHVTFADLIETQDVSSKIYDISLDLIHPISDRMTFFGTLSLIRSTDQTQETESLFGDRMQITGAEGRVSLKIYFPR